MATADQPPKKRRLYDPNQALSVVTLSHEEIVRRRRNREEIRSLYDCYRRIKFCVAQKDDRLMPDFEQAYLSLITASRGCTSVQRVVAELIPRYASFCPTALEAAAKVSINMYNWSSAIIMRGEDWDGVAYQTAKACIFGLVDICCTASYEAPTSSVIRGICSAVFENVLTFITSTFEGEDICKINDRDIQKLQDESFCDLKQEPEDNNEPPLRRLWRFRALSLLRIFFSFPKNLLAACFEILVSGGAAIVHRQAGKYFLDQLTSDLDAAEVTGSMNKVYDGESFNADLAQNREDCKRSKEFKSESDDNNSLEKSSLLPDNCFMKMAIDREPSLRVWMLSRYKKLSESHESEKFSELSSFLEKSFGSLSELIKEADSAKSDGDNFDRPRYVDPAFPAYKLPVQRVENVDISPRDCSLRVNDLSVGDALHKDAADKVVCQSVKSLRSLLLQKVIFQANVGEMSASLKDYGDGHVEYPCLARPSPKDLTGNHFTSAVTRKQPDCKNDDSDVGNLVAGLDKMQDSSIDLAMPTKISASGRVPNIFPSPRQLSTAWLHASSNHILWNSELDSAAMDVFPASKQLWVGSLGHDASEMLVRLQFEDFGPLEHFLFVPAKDFTLIEYRRIIDAVRAREYMQGSSQWGGCLHIKFLDRGLGSSGFTNGIAVGDSCYVYIGKVSTLWAKDEILHELMMVEMRDLCMVTELATESALLLEFGTPEEAVNATMHIRRTRNEIGRRAYPGGGCIMRGYSKDKCSSSSQLLVKQIDASVSDEELVNAFSRYGEITRCQFNRQGGCCLIDFRSYEFSDLAKSHLHGARFGPTSILVEFATDSPGISAKPVAFSPHTTSLHDTSSGSSGSRMVNTSGYMPSHGDSPPNMEGNPMNPYHSSFMYKSEGSIHELISTRMKAEKLGSQVHNVHSSQSTWANMNSAETLEVGSRKLDESRSSTPMDHSFAGPSTPHAQQVWQYKKQEVEPQMLAHQRLPCPPIAAHGGSMVPPPVPISSYVRPAYPIPSGSWDNSATNPSFSLSQVSPGMKTAENRHFSACPAIPFIPSSVTMLSQLPGGSIQSFDQMVTITGSSNPPPPLPPHAPPPLPSSLPPLPLSHPPSVPPPPHSPLLVQPSNWQSGETFVHHPWRGTLTKSGVHYCTIYATREDSTACKYSNAVSEPIGWPARLDVTKRTDLNHVKTTFASTRSHRVSDIMLPSKRSLAQLARRERERKERATTNISQGCEHMGSTSSHSHTSHMLSYRIGSSTSYNLENFNYQMQNGLTNHTISNVRPKISGPSFNQPMGINNSCVPVNQTNVNIENMTIQMDNEDYNEELDLQTTVVTNRRHYLGKMDILCRNCSALHWNAERLSKSSIRLPLFGMCCLQGKIKLPLISTLPPALQSLFDGDDKLSKSFRENMRQYNATNAFTSLGAKLDDRVLHGVGPTCFTIHGELRHRIGSLLPSEGGEPVYSQLYIYVLVVFHCPWVEML